MRLGKVNTMSEEPEMFLVTNKVQPQYGKKQEFIDVWRSAVGSRMERQPGFITAWVLTAPNDDTVTVMSQWETEASYYRWRNSAVYRQVMPYIGKLIRERLGEKTYRHLAEVESAPPAQS